MTRAAPGRYEVKTSADGFEPFASKEEVIAGEVSTVTYRPRAVVAADPSGAQEIRVVGERPAREVTRRAIEQREITRIPGTNGDALRAVENMPGVARSPGLGGMLIVRGSAPQDTGVFVDGTQIPIAFHFGGVSSVVPSHVLERIDFLPGNFGPEYGRAMGGNIDIGLRSPAKDKVHGMAQVDLLDARFVFEAPLSTKTRMMVAGRRSHVDAWIGGVLEAGGAVGVRTAPVYYDYQAMLEHDVTSSTTARLAIFGSDDALKLTLNSTGADPAEAGDLGVATVAYANSGSGRIFGGELLLRYKPDARFFGWIAYTLSRSERRADDTEQLRTFDYDQTHILTALGSYKLGRGWEVGGRWRYVTGNPHTPVASSIYDADAGAYAPVNGAPFSGRTAAFHRLDVRVDKTWTFKDWKLSAYLDVQNAYFRANPEGESHNYNYSKSAVTTGLPFLPVIGLRGEL